MYYFIDTDYQKGDLYLKGFDDIERINDELSNLEETKIENIELEIATKTGKKNDFLLGTSYPILSKKVKSILEEKLEQDNFQFISTNLEGYWMLHMIGTIKCFDWGKSTYTRNPPFLKEVQDRPNKVENLVFDESKIDADIFRMYEESVTLFISERLRDIFEENGVTGLEYKPLEDYRKGIVI